MRREIICAACDRERLVSFGAPIVDTDHGPRLALPIGPPERHKSERGKAVRDLCCDHCGGHIARGESATAVSTWLDGGAYFAWERDYIERRMGD